MQRKMAVSIRRTQPSDAGVLADICYRAFATIAAAHSFLPDLPTPEVAAGVMQMLIGHPQFYGVAAEVEGRLAGSNFLDERNSIVGVGPVTIDPALQNSGVGRALMQAVLDRSAERGCAGIRLVQVAYHGRSLALYLKLGFGAREQLACLQGAAIGASIPGCIVRPATVADQPACNRLCFLIHGHDRAGELADAVAQGSARVVERAGRIAGYATILGFFGHAVAETNDDLKALIGAAEAFAGPGILVPVRNTELMRWCLARGLRITQPLTLMSMGLYNQPEGVWLASITY